MNAVIGIVQERKAQSSLEALRNMRAPTARVVREGEESILPARELVPGDLVFLGDGSMVPADLRLVDAANLKVQEASLTGESVPSEKDADVLLAADAPWGTGPTWPSPPPSSPTDGPPASWWPPAWTPRWATSPTCWTGTRSWTRPSSASWPHSARSSPSWALAVALIVLLGGLYGRPLIPQFLLAVSLAISVIPESLPATATIVMALGVQRMARHKALDPQPARRRDAGRRHRHLHGQDRHPHREPHERRARRRWARTSTAPGARARRGARGAPRALRELHLCRRPLQRRRLATAEEGTPGAQTSSATPPRARCSYWRATSASTRSLRAKPTRAWPSAPSTPTASA